MITHLLCKTRTNFPRSATDQKKNQSILVLEYLKISHGARTYVLFQPMPNAHFCSNSLKSGFAVARNLQPKKVELILPNESKIKVQESKRIS